MKAKKHPKASGWYAYATDKNNDGELRFLYLENGRYAYFKEYVTDPNHSWDFEEHFIKDKGWWRFFGPIKAEGVAA